MYSLPFIEIHAVDHCNNDCRWCHNYSPFSPEEEYDASDYFSGLDVLKSNGLHVSGISIMGGEPFLHSDITGFAYKLMERYVCPIFITTNGFWLSEETVKLYKHLWKILSLIKISRYPTIEKRLGGYDEAKRIAMAIKEHNPKIKIEFPVKSVFNKLETFSEPVEVRRFCGNSQCTALLRDMTMHRCGAGAYKKFAPEGFLSEGFRNCRHMSYDLKKYDINSFALWRSRYPLDACSYCNFANETPQVSWKVEKGFKPFNSGYEVGYHFNAAKQMIMHEMFSEAAGKAVFIRNRYGERAEVCMLDGLLAAQNGDIVGGLEAFGTALKLAPENIEAATYFKLLRRQIRPE